MPIASRVRHLAARQQAVLQRIEALEQATLPLAAQEVPVDDTQKQRLPTPLEAAQQTAVDSAVPAVSSSPDRALLSTLVLPQQHWQRAQQAIARELDSKRILSYDFHQAPTDYYELSLEQRRQCLGAPTTEHLCKTLVMRNTKHRVTLPSGNRECFNPEFFCVVVQVLPHWQCSCLHLSRQLLA